MAVVDASFTNNTFRLLELQSKWWDSKNSKVIHKRQLDRLEVVVYGIIQHMNSTKDRLCHSLCLTNALLNSRPGSCSGQTENMLPNLDFGWLIQWQIFIYLHCPQLVTSQPVTRVGLANVWSELELKNASSDWLKHDPIPDIIISDCQACTWSRHWCKSLHQ